MDQDHVFVLIHSPLVGGLTWTLVADQMQQRGLSVLVPLLTDSPDSKDPYWKQHAESASQALKDVLKDIPVILVAHSGAGPLLPAIRAAIANPIHAYVFVDAGLPKDGFSRLSLMREENLEWAEQFQAELERGDHFPTWSSDDLRDIIPNESLREKLVAELHPRALDFFTEPIPVFQEWPDAPCIYILFSPPYKGAEIQAKQLGWKTYKLEAGHFHMLVDPLTVTEMIVKAVGD
jgi:hypothetical protein